ncbi:aminotransferase class I/II-fold pyridoxal phosphate-dependent enzyme [Planktotalea sp.]|uniref:aminotransferase class I/II-fold pyridoxal phosphate-dependent enzyme n=1 Tax=Planktotalea sp. TaxID=2029877 RepID=UPI0035C863A0
MKVKIHTLFEYLLETTESEPEAFVGFSLSKSPVLGDFLDELDPTLSLDWNGRSFRGLPELRAHVLRQASLDHICNVNDVLITAGAAEANYLALRQLLEPGDEIVIEKPGWPQAEVMAKAQGAVVKTGFRRATSGWDLDLDELRSLVTPKTKLIFLTNPNNPTGRLLSLDDLSEIVAIARNVGAWLIVDEVYAGLEWAAPRPPSIAGLYERGITTGSVSKALGLQGLRTGWMICQDKDLIIDAVILRENSSEIMNILGEVIAEIALRPDRYNIALSAARAAGLANLAELNNFIENQPLLSWIPPEAGLIGLAKLGNGLDSSFVAKRLLEPPYKTFLLPGSAYDQPDHIRVGVGGGTEANLALGLSRLAAFLNAQA